MSEKNSNPQNPAKEKADADAAAKLAQEKIDAEAKAKEDAEKLAKEKADADAAAEADEADSDGWVSPLSVNYKKLEELLGEKTLAEYIGEKLPDEEVKRIEVDFEIYLKNK